MKYLITEKQLKTLRKYMKTFINEKQEMSENKFTKGLTGLALAGGLSLGSPSKAQDYVNPNYSNTISSPKKQITINNVRKLKYELSQIFNVQGYNDFKNPIEATPEAIREAILKNNYDTSYYDIFIPPSVFNKFISESKTGNSQYKIVKYKDKHIIIWNDEN